MNAQFNVRAIYDEGEVTLGVSDYGVLGFGSNLEDAIDDLAVELDTYAARVLSNPDRYGLSQESLDALTEFAGLSHAEQISALVSEPR